MAPTEFILNVIKSFIALLIILDPFLCVVVFISLTKGMNKTEKAKQAFIAVSVAFGLLIFFLFLGLWLLDLMGISFPSFIVAGGVILLILGVQSVLGIEFSKKDNSHKKVAAIVIGTPLLSGPGAMTTVIILSQHYGYWPPLIALILSLGITWIMMIWSEKITKLMGARLIEVISRVLGLILAALAIEFVKNGVSEMIKAFK